MALLIVSFRTFFSGWKTMMYTLGAYRQMRATEADRLMATQRVVI